MGIVIFYTPIFEGVVEGNLSITLEDLGDIGEVGNFSTTLNPILLDLLGNASVITGSFNIKLENVILSINSALTGDVFKILISKNNGKVLISTKTGNIISSTKTGRVLCP